jgi:hypothetical protein
VAKEPAKLDGATKGRTAATQVEQEKAAKETVKCRLAVNLALVGRLGS